MEKKVILCEFNLDTACAEVKYADGSMIAIYCPRAEDQFADNIKYIMKCSIPMYFRKSNILDGV